MAWTSDIKRKKRQKTETKTLRRRLFLAQCWLRGQFKTNQLFLDKCSRTRALPDGNFPKAVQDIGVIVEIPLCKKLPKKLHQFHRWFRRRKRTRNIINLTELSLQNLIAWQKKGVACSKRQDEIISWQFTKCWSNIFGAFNIWHIWIFLERAYVLYVLYASESINPSLYS